MLKKSRLFLTALLALLICIASATSAFATNLNSDGALMSADEDTPAQATITKNFRLPVGTIVPDVLFQFTATAISVDGNTDANVLSTMPALNNLSTSYTSTDTGTLANNIVSIEKETGNIFEHVVFPHAGIYVYEITEETNTNPTIDTNAPHEVLHYSGATYTLTVYVANKAAGDGTYIYAIGTVVTTPDNGEQEAGNKVDPTPGGDGTSYFYSQMIFTNDYIKTNGAVDPENPDPLSESTLIVSKHVAGDFASKEQYFDFSMTLTIPSIVQDVPAYYKAYVVKDGAIIDPENMVDATLIGTDDGVPYIMISTSEATAFQLRDGKELVFVNTPVGTMYTLEEAAVANYVPSFIITTNGVAGANHTGTISTGISTDPQFVGELANRADFINTRDSVTPTGLNLNDLPFFVLSGIGLCSLITFTVVKIRKSRA